MGFENGTWYILRKNGEVICSSNDWDSVNSLVPR